MIQIANLQSKLRLPVSKIRKLADRILLEAGQESLDVSFAFVTGRKMRSLNKRYLNHDYHTDVLAFPQSGPLLGEVIVSTEYAIQEAATRKISKQEELLRYVAHGMLHLLGHDDQTPRKKARMWAAQERFLKLILKK